MPSIRVHLTRATVTPHLAQQSATAAHSGGWHLAARAQLAMEAAPVTSVQLVLLDNLTAQTTLVTRILATVMVHVEPTVHVHAMRIMQGMRVMPARKVLSAIQSVVTTRAILIHATAMEPAACLHGAKACQALAAAAAASLETTANVATQDMLAILTVFQIPAYRTLATATASV